MKKLLTIIALLVTVAVGAQNVGIGISNPQQNLHVHNEAVPLNTDVSIAITNNLTGSTTADGARLRMVDFDFVIQNNEAAGNLSLATGNFNRLLIKPNGNIGINNTDPQTVLHVNARAFPATNYNEAIRVGGTTPFISFYDDAVLKGYVQASLGGFEIGTKSLQTMNFFTNDIQRMTILANGRIGIGTITPSNNLHVHDEFSNQDASIILTNNLTGTNTLRGGRFRLLNSDLILFNYEATGKIQFNTAFNTRMTIGADGKVGIGTTAPNHFLDITAGGTAYGINVEHSSSNVRGISSNMGNNQNTIGVMGSSFYNSTAGNYAIGVHGISGEGGSFLNPTDNYGVVGESRNAASGIGVLGTSTSPSPFITQAAILGINFSTAASTYGIIGAASGSSGAGVVGRTFNATAGLLGYATATSTGPAIKSSSLLGSSLIGLELENGAIKVSGTNRTVFQHVTTAGNITSNETLIPNTTLANSATDMLIITPVWEGVYINAPVGVYFSGGSWRIFRQDLGSMPVGIKFNVLVVKQ